VIELSSSVVGKQYDLFKLEQLLKPKGYAIGGNWDYDHGYFDYKLDNQEDGYQYLRLPFRAVDGQLDSRNCTVELQTPFLLSHEYQDDIDQDHSAIGNASALYNQFQEPKNKDAEVPSNLIDRGKALIQELETIL
jgi:hypothetical protein